MDSLLDFNFSEDSHDAYDYSSDLLLSDGFNSSLTDDDTATSAALLEPKSELPDYLVNDLPDVSPLDEIATTDTDALFANEEPPLPSEGMNMDIFELSFVPEDFDFMVKSEPIPLHCAPLEPSEKLSLKREAPRTQVKTESKKARTETSNKAVRPARPHLMESTIVKKDDEKYQKRLVANKKSAQASRERKKALRCNLEDRVQLLAEDNASLALEMEKLESENQELKNEFAQLQQVLSLKVNESSNFLSEMMADKPAEDAAASTPSASMYLMLVMYSLSKCLKTGPTTLPLPLTTQVPSPLIV